MRKIFPVLGLLLATAPAFAGPFDGLYRPDVEWAEGWDCQSIGSDGGALAVRDDVYYGVESACQLTNPVAVNGMSAVLYDAQCSGEGETWSKRMMFMPLEGGLAVISDGVVNQLKRCP